MGSSIDAVGEAALTTQTRRFLHLLRCGKGRLQQDAHENTDHCNLLG
jgi:hypothetical protein